MASAEMAELSRLIRANRPPQADFDVAARRQTMEQQQAALSVPADISRLDVTLAGVPCRWVSCADSRPDHLVLYLHGGGYCMGSLDTHTELMGRIARAGRCRVVGAGYRLAPEHPFPAALEDSVAVYRALVRGTGGARIAVAGDSAGGGLAAATLVRLRDNREPLPRAAVLLSPWTDLTAQADSYRTRAAQDPMIDPAEIRQIASCYVGRGSAHNPLISPIFADLSGLPPLLIQVGDHEVLLNDATGFAARARDADVAVELEVWEEAFHVFQALPQLPEAAQALTRVGAFLAAHWDG